MCHSVEFVPTLRLLSSGGIHLVDLDVKRRQQQQKEEALQLVVRNLWRKYDWRAPNRLLVVQIGVSGSQAKAFKAHAAPQGVCRNLINALKLLPNQQKDGFSPIQSIATGLYERCRKGNVEGLRNFFFKLIFTVPWTWAI